VVRRNLNYSPGVEATSFTQLFIHFFESATAGLNQDQNIWSQDWFTRESALIDWVPWHNHTNFAFPRNKMKQLLFTITGIVMLLPSQFAAAQRTCGIPAAKADLIAANHDWQRRIEDQRRSLQGIADAWIAGGKAGRVHDKLTTLPTIPVVFHILITDSMLTVLGGVAGVEQRVDSQMAVLNRDFNAANYDDLVHVPAGWVSRTGNTGISFGLAHTTPAGFGSPGYELSIIPDSPGGFGSTLAFNTAKHASTGGLDAWDVTKYLNIWCINPSDATGLLGATIPKSFTTGTSGYPASEMGICIYWAALGKRVSPADVYPLAVGPGDYYDQGKTLIHEAGHFFEIWHTWGDDAPYYCPWSGAHKDDGLADTPPEGGPKFTNDPFTIAGGTYFDTCRYDGAIDTQTTLLGVPSLDFMNYTDDAGMYLFTTQQAAVMASMVAAAGENYSLTQNPGLLNWSVKTGVAAEENLAGLNIFPNPATGRINITYNAAASLQRITVIDVTGRQAVEICELLSKDYYSIDLSAFPKGIYFVRCTFAAGSITRKIVLQ